jgi:hypothetical protein
LPRQDILAGHFGAFIWRVILAHYLVGFHGQETSKQKKGNERKRMHNQ